MTKLTVFPYIFDLELSGRCNTVCSFCPRHEMKRGENFMTEENFGHFFSKLKNYAEFFENKEVYLPAEKVKAQVGKGIESPLRIILCGMGESLMHKKCPEWIAAIRKEIGIRVSVVTNGVILREKMVNALKEADLTVALVSVPGIDRESYSKYMKIDWDQVLANIERANEILPGRIQINATIPDDAKFNENDVTAFWQSKGIPIAGISRCHNRGGFLSDHSLTGRFGVTNSNFCGILARHNFIAWDGNILSCCHDLHAENIIGHVSSDDFLRVAEQKTPVIETGPKYRICGNCNDGERCHAQQILAGQTDRSEIINKKSRLNDSAGI